MVYGLWTTQFPLHRMVESCLKFVLRFKMFKSDFKPGCVAKHFLTVDNILAPSNYLHL